MGNISVLKMWGKELNYKSEKRKGMASCKSNSRNWHKGIALALNISHIANDSDTATLLDNKH